ncbi:hypothetical protein D3C79_1071240 [compost metagenome]
MKAIDGNITLENDFNYDVEMIIDIGELSSLAMGVVTVQELFMLSKVKISDEQYLQKLHQLFYVYDKPMCMTAF